MHCGWHCIVNHFPSKNALVCRILHIQSQKNFRGWHSLTPVPQKHSPAAWTQTPISACLASQRSHCCCFTKRQSSATNSHWDGFDYNLSSLLPTWWFSTSSNSAFHFSQNSSDPQCSFHPYALNDLLSNMSVYSADEIRRRADSDYMRKTVVLDRPPATWLAVTFAVESRLPNSFHKF